MPTSAPVLDAFRTQKPAHSGKDTIQRNHFHRKDAVQTSKKVDSQKKAAAASGAASEAKQSGDSTGPLGKRSREEGCGRRSSHPESVRKGCLHDAADDRKRILCSVSGQAISLAAKHQLEPPPMSPNHVTLKAPSSSSPSHTLQYSPLQPHMHLLSRLRALTVLDDGRGACLGVASRTQGSSRRPSIVLVSRRAATGRSAQPKGRKRRKKSLRRMDPLARRGRTTHGHGAGQPDPTVLQCEAKQP